MAKNFANTSNLKTQSAGKTLAVKTVVQTLKPRKYAQVGK